MIKKSLSVGALAALLFSLAAPLRAADLPSHHRFNLLGENVGLTGYDPVSYFPEGGGKPEKGHIKIAEDYQGVTFRFASEEHRAVFKKNPEKFLPQYGGWCAWAVGAIGKRVDADAENYELRNGKLYVFYRDPQLDTRELWRKEPDSLVGKADAAWPALAQ